jgi:predicted Zn-dependent protease
VIAHAAVSKVVSNAAPKRIVNFFKPHRHLPLLGLLIALCLPLAISPATAQAPSSALPQLGDGQEMSLVDEKKLGQRIVRELYRDPDYIDDPLLTSYVERIWQPLLAAARARGDLGREMDTFAWQLLMGRDRSINAFALPGAYFGVHLGLVATVSSRDELASVLAHELTHASQRHIARQITRQNQQAPWLLGAMILGSIAASKNPQAASAVITGSQAVSAQSQLNFSRDMEREADRVGYALLQDAGFDVRGFVGMFEKLQHANRINDNGSFPYLRSHPLTTERLGDMQARLQLQSPREPNPALQQALQTEHVLMRERARLLSDASADSLRKELAAAQTALRTPLAPQAPASQRIARLGQLYAGALAAHLQKDTATAMRYALAAREAFSGLGTHFAASLLMEHAQSAIEQLICEIALQPGSNGAPDLNAAQTALSNLRALPSLAEDRAVLLMSARVALATGPTNPASSTGPRSTNSPLALTTQALQQRSSQYPQDALTWEALAQLQQMQGMSLRSLRSAAEARVAVLDYNGALDRLRAAQAWARDNAGNPSFNHVDASIIDTRSRAVQQLLREQQSERDGVR